MKTLTGPDDVFAAQGTELGVSEYTTISQHDVNGFAGFAFGVNYGLNRVRFPAPVPVGSKLRARARLATVARVPGGLQVEA
jgi:acyl dehydratase